MVKNTRTCNKSFAEDYMLLSPSDVGLFDLIKLLLSKHIAHRKFIESPAGTVIHSFAHRFVIFISIVAQKLLDLVSKPLAWLGATFEFLANFMNANGSLTKLGWNLLRGKIVLPDRESPEFLSSISLLDTRRTLDSNISREDPRYTSGLAIMASKAAYENQAYIKETVENYWKMEFLGFFNCWNDYEEDHTTQVFMWSDKNGGSELIGVAFRGTSPFNANDWSSDVDLSWYQLSGIGKVHAGFLKALGLQKNKGWPTNVEFNEKKLYAYYVIRNILKDRLKKNPKAKILITGHSLGAALATLFPALLKYHDEIDILKRLEGVHTFGQPRVGNGKFGEFMKDVMLTHGMKYHRFVYCNDLVPRVPFDNSDFMFKHFGGCFYYNSFYRGQVMIDEPNKNYFSIFAIIPMFVNAIWELIRSFIIVYQDGPDYSENFACRGFRLIGLLIAGLPAHGPQDYVNLTRLGSPELFRLVDWSNNEDAS